MVGALSLRDGVVEVGAGTAERVRPRYVPGKFSPIVRPAGPVAAGGPAEQGAARAGPIGGLY